MESRASARIEAKNWRARRDSNPLPSDPKSRSRQSEQRRSIRAWSGHREDTVLVDSGVSLDPARRESWSHRVNLEESDALCWIGCSSNAHDGTEGWIIRLDPDSFAARPSVNRACMATAPRSFGRRFAWSRGFAFRLCYEIAPAAGLAVEVA